MSSGPERQQWGRQRDVARWFAAMVGVGGGFAGVEWTRGRE